MLLEGGLGGASETLLSNSGTSLSEASDLEGCMRPLVCILDWADGWWASECRNGMSPCVEMGILWNILRI